MTDRIGQRFGDYRLIRSLGGGTFGDVYLGEHIYENTQTAVKVFKTQLTSNQFKDFLNEVRMVLLKHPHIVQVLDFGVSEDDIPFLVMEHAPNGTLLQRHPRGIQLPLTTTVTYVKQIAAALQHAHNQRRIHRDVKPENILIGRNNEILLGDFGIAVVAHNTHSQRTQETIGGTARYMAPEQWQGKPLPATDQYALGIVTYEWIAGVSPFIGDQLQLMYQHIQSSPPPLQEKIPTLSLEAEKVILKALAKDPKERFPSIEDFANALEQAWQSQEPTQIIQADQASLQTQVYIPTQPPLSSSIPFTQVSPEAASSIQKPTSVVKSMEPASPEPNQAGLPSIIVDQRGNGHFTTIGAALKAAKDNDRMVVRPGIYSEELTLSKPVELIADGLVKQVVVESQNGDCLLMQTDRAMVSGFTFRCQAGKNGKSCYGIDIVRGRLVLEDCHVTSDSLACIAIYNVNTDPIIRRCHIFDGQGGGIVIYRNGRGIIEDCDVYRNKFAGVDISEQGNPLVRQCRIFDGQTGGVLVRKDGRGTLEDCDIYGNKLAGVEIREQGNPMIKQCEIRDGKQHGVYVHSSGRGFIEDCQIHGNQQGNWEIEPRCRVVRRGNKE